VLRKKRVKDFVVGVYLRYVLWHWLMEACWMIVTVLVIRIRLWTSLWLGSCNVFWGRC